MELTIFESNLFLFLFMATALHGTYLCLLILFRSKRIPSLTWLGLLLLVLSLWLFNYLFYLSDIMRENPHLLGFVAAPLYLIGPFYYFFIAKAIDASRKLSWIDGLHLIPFFLVGWQWIDIYLLPSAQKLVLIERVYETHEVPDIWQFVKGFQWVMLVLFYIVVVWIKFFRNLSPSVSADLVHVLKRFTIGLGALFTLYIALPLWSIIGGFNGAFSELSMVLAIAIFIHLLAYFVLREASPERYFETLAPPLKYATSPLNTDQIRKLQKRIIDYLAHEKPWLQADFNVSQLAEGVELPRHHLSQVLNEGLQMSFNDLTAKHRIDEVKRRLQRGDMARFSMAGLARECGFGSKSSFNRAFKKMTGCTPSEWVSNRMA